MTEPAFRAAAWAWADHLRAGGTTPWLDWLAAGSTAGSAPGGTTPDGAPGRTTDSATGTVATRGRVPGAGQLELVRRLAERARRPPGDPGFAALADLALGRSGPGRGPGRLPLLWPEQAARRTGTPAVDPATIGRGEIVRLATGLLAELLVRSAPSVPPRRRMPQRRPWSPAFHLAGAPVTTAHVRASLAAAGRAEGGRRPEVLVFAEPLDLALAQVWSRRVQHGAPVRWITFAGSWARRDELPPALDLPAIAQAWARRVGPERVHVVAGPDPRRTAAEILGLRVGQPVDPDPRDLSAEEVDVLQRLNRVLNVRAEGAVRDALQQRALRLLPASGLSGLAFPEVHRDWLDERARRLADDVRAGGYAVHGDLAGIAPRHTGLPHPRRPDVLDLVLDTCLRAAELKS